MPPYINAILTSGIVLETRMSKLSQIPMYSQNVFSQVWHTYTWGISVELVLCIWNIQTLLEARFHSSCMIHQASISPPFREFWYCFCAKAIASLYISLRVSISFSYSTFKFLMSLLLVISERDSA